MKDKITYDFRKETVQTVETQPSIIVMFCVGIEGAIVQISKTLQESPTLAKISSVYLSIIYKTLIKIPQKPNNIRTSDGGYIDTCV